MVPICVMRAPFKLCQVANITTVLPRAAIHVSGLKLVDKSLLMQLRKETGFAISNCKKALEQYDGNLEMARNWLNEEAQKEGWATAKKLFNRSTPQGLVGLNMSENSALLVEVNCETDFVARNDDFRNLTELVAKFGNVQKNTDSIKEEWLTKENLESLSSEDGRTLADESSLCMGKIRENISLTRACHISVPKDVSLYAYVHPSAVGQNSILGTLGAVMAYKSNSAATEESCLREICCHIAGCNPKTIYPKDQLSSESSSSEDSSSSDEENEVVDESLHNQKFLADNSITVKHYLDENNIEVLHFIRLKLGETFSID